MVNTGSKTGVDGIVANGNAPIVIIPKSKIGTAPTRETKELKKSAVDDEASVKADCYLNADGYQVTRTAETRQRQRLCEKNKVTVKTGETIEAQMTFVWDGQNKKTEMNKVYDVLAEGSEVYIAQAYGLDSDAEWTASSTICDVVRATVSMRAKNTPVEGEDLTVTATLSVKEYFEDCQVVA